MSCICPLDIEQVPKFYDNRRGVLRVDDSRAPTPVFPMVVPLDILDNF